MKHPLPAALAAASLLAGCANPSHLVFHQSSSIGVDASANTDTGQIHVALGYNRQTNTLIPKTLTENDEGVPEQEAMSAISTSEITIKWLGVHDVNEQFATGKAARNLAEKPGALGQLTTLSKEVTNPSH